MSGRNISWNKENYKRFGKVLKSSLKWAQAEVSSFSGSVFMFIKMGLVNFFHKRICPDCFFTNMFLLPTQFASLVSPTDSINVHIQKVLPKSFNLSGCRSFWLLSFKIKVIMFQIHEIRVWKNGLFKANSEGSHQF